MTFPRKLLSRFKILRLRKVVQIDENQKAMTHGRVMEARFQ